MGFAACGQSATSNVQQSERPPEEAEAPAEARSEVPSETPEVAEQAEPEAAPEADPGPQPGDPIANDDWAAVLAAFGTDGGFRYAALAADAEAKARLDAYVAAIATAQPAEWSRDEQLAFYINAYNALTISSVVANWPMDSVMNVEGFFDAAEHQVAGESITLNTLENARIRETFHEGRIHFAVNCASVGCPPLRGTPFEAATLDAALEEQTVAAVRATSTVRGRRVTVSKLFEWFADDFTPDVREFIASRLEEADATAVRNTRNRLRFADYDWAVNAVE